MNRSLPRILRGILLLSLAAICSCASGVTIPPPGGPADTIPPSILSTIPGNGTTNFRGETVEIEFSEYVEESRVAAAVVITPIPRIPPEFDWSGRTLEITFREPLLENRTYTVNLGSAISDPGGNRLGRPFSLRFSTGDQIDSGRIQGEVIGKSKIPAFIYAYVIPSDTARFNDTLRPDSTRPDFIAPIGDDGSFSLEGLPTGNFRIFAVADAFSDGIFTPGEDAFGVPTGDVHVASATEPVTGLRIRLRPSADDLRPPALYSAVSVNRRRSELRFSEPVDTATLRVANFSLTASGSDVAINQAWRSPVNPLAVQLSHAEIPPAVEAVVTTRGLRDTAGNGLPDSVSTTRFTTGETIDTVPPRILPLSVDSVRAYTFPDSILISFDENVAMTEGAEPIRLRDTAGPSARFRLTRRSPAQFIARPLDTLFGAAEGFLEIDLRRFTDEAGNRYDSTARLRLAIGIPRQKGSMEGTLTDSAAPNSLHVIILRAMNNGMIYRKEKLKSGPWAFTSLPEGEYEVTAFRDDDGNGEYNYGSIIPFRHAEQFATWRGTVRVRPRWSTNKVDLVFPSTKNQ